MLRAFDAISFSQGGDARIPAALHARFPALSRHLAAAVAWYGGRIDWTRVRIVFGANPTRASLCLRNVIFIGDGIGEPGARHLVHELGHVWQAQTGQWQVTLGAVDQLRNLFTNVYDYGGRSVLEDVAAGRRALLSFNREQQAELLADLFVTGRSPP